MGYVDKFSFLNVLGLELLPSLRWAPEPGYYGFINYDGDLIPAEEAIVSLAGSLATFGVAVAAQIGLWLTRPRRGIVRWGMLTLCFFWLDILTHTLPTLGIPAYLFFGKQTITQSAEAYLAARSLGMPGGFFQALVIGLSVELLALTVVRWHRPARSDKLNKVIYPT